MNKWMYGDTREGCGVGKHVWKLIRRSVAIFLVW